MDKTYSNDKDAIKPKVTVITVVYNNVNSIEKTIKSVLAQTYYNLEYIIIDGGSKDGTVEIIKAFSREISYWKSEADGGIYDAMNKGLSKATGEWINFMNSGDIFRNEHVIEEVFSSNSQSGKSFIYSDFIVEQSKGVEKLFKADFTRGIVLHQSVIYKKELHNKLGYYLVTKPIIVSDYLFFNSIPESIVQKTSVIISQNDNEGVSQAAWCYYQKKCVDFIFGRISLKYMLAAIFYYKLIMFLNFIFGSRILVFLQKFNKNISSSKLL